MKHLYPHLILLLAFGIPAVHAQDYSSSVVGTDFDIITDSDPSCFRVLKFKGVKSAEMPDKTNDAGLFQKAFVFSASYSDRSLIKISVDADFKSEADAKKEALRYATRLGKLPSVLRSGVKRVVVHKGNPDTTAFSDHGLIVVYSANATKRISTHDLEETLFHESVHAAWDKTHAKSPEWRRAQFSDGTFATRYAKKKPQLEDLAESALFAYALIHHADRIPLKDKKRIAAAIPARIRFVETLIPPDKPIFFKPNAPERGDAPKKPAAKKASSPEPCCADSQAKLIGR